MIAVHRQAVSWPSGALAFTPPPGHYHFVGAHGGWARSWVLYWRSVGDSAQLCGISATISGHFTEEDAEAQHGE